MRAAILLLPALLTSACDARRPSPPSDRTPTVVAAATTKPPVVLELFTSEGCSSCPSAETLLTKLKDEPNIYALAFHVDYWNYSWTDRFSSSAITKRQRAYGFGTYTPQLVVQGRTHVLGSDESAARSEIESTEATRAKLELTSDVMGDRTTITWTLDQPGGELTVAVTENGIVVTPTAGENKGDTLRHDAVVRAFAVVEASPKGSLSLALPADLIRAQAQVIAFAQSPAGPVRAAARTTL